MYNIKRVETDVSPTRQRLIRSFDVCQKDYKRNKAGKVYIMFCRVLTNCTACKQSERSSEYQGSLTHYKHGVVQF
jgi:hypothetical protein